MKEISPQIQDSGHNPEDTHVLSSNSTQARIIALDSIVVDQIAAGEVLERPAHMVKELIENALDAGSTSLELHLGEGGRSLTLIDDGRGFHPEDLKLALQRHTTSKLTSASDLWNLSTYGFRGEALASISAVSHMNIRTHRQNEKCVELKSEFGSIQTIVESSQDVGTQIEISRLYENTPARLKFLKTDATEVMEIRKVLLAFGLCQPHVSLKLFFRDRLEFFWPGVGVSDGLASSELEKSELLERNKIILGTKELYGWMQDFGDIQIQVQFAPPHETAKSNRKLWTFVQNRWVQEPMILAAIKDGFQNTLLPGEYPIGALFITVPKDSVDVNVHPTKSKIKFKDQSAIYRAVRNTLLSFVENSPWRKEFLTPTRSHSNDIGCVPNYFDGLDAGPLRQTNFELKAYRPESQSLGSHGLQSSQSQRMVINPEELYPSASRNLEEIPERQDFSGRQDFEDTSMQSFAASSASSLQVTQDIQSNTPWKSAENSFWSNLMVIGQVGKTYVVTQNQTEIVYVDQHAAHERCLFEKLWQGFKNGIALETQRHLLPISFKVEDESILDILLKHQSSLAQIGLHFEQSGPQYIEIPETPAMIKDKAVVQSLEKMIEQILKFGESFVFEDVISDVFATMACHSAIRAGQILTMPEMNELLNLMDEYPTTSYCPHGRPVFVRYSFNQLEKDFCRRV